MAWKIETLGTRDGFTAAPNGRTGSLDARTLENFPLDGVQCLAERRGLGEVRTERDGIHEIADGVRELRSLRPLVAAPTTIRSWR